MVLFWEKKLLKNFFIVYWIVFIFKFYFFKGGRFIVGFVFNFEILEWRFLYGVLFFGFICRSF